MNEKFPAPHTEVIVGNFDDLKPELFTDREMEVSKGVDGEVITDPRLISERLLQEPLPEPYRKLEIEKSDRELNIIKLAKENVERFAAEYGRTEFPVLSPDRIHFLKEGGLAKASEERMMNGAQSVMLGRIVVDRREDLPTAITTFHELWHGLASYQALQVTKEGKLDWYRSGLSIRSRDGKKNFFKLFDEGLVGYATKRFVDEVLRQTPGYREEIEQIEAAGGLVDTTREIEREYFLDIVDSIVEKRPEEFSDREELVKEFMRAQVTGNILPIARIVDGTYKKGYFRKLAKF